MELWTASAKTALRNCLDELALAGLMILIVGSRYESVAEDGRSFTLIEYEQAKELQLPTAAGADPLVRELGMKV